MIDVQQLRALVELSRLGTVSAAADSLGFSQSTVSHQLAALSRATGAVLLTRAGRGVRLTEEGRALAARGQEVLDLLDRAERETVSMAHAEAGRVRLAAFPSAVASLVPGVLDAVGRQYPGLEVELVDAEPPEALDALRRGRVDAALSFSYTDDDAGEGLQSAHLLDDVLYLVSHPGGITRIADGAQCRWVTGCARCHEELIAVGRANDFTPETAYASDDYVAVQALVAAGVGAALLPGMALSAYRHEGVQVRPLAQEHRRVEVVTRAESPRPLAIDVLVEACRTAARSTSLRRPAVRGGANSAGR
ncbi:LysR family transcriptional regulator [Actinomyces viscosus]|uniref:HTH-type transcriptional regulator gltC n=1 Tax=Actinomyces viscosus TaxID=1656 RepID=A0A3S4VLY7_ACTVI|nr:LysR family transcriptional regulator [Actinomyces viscosus]TFH52845.1 LysR family transcriptional regulator [Actinomyces viscosus]VEI18511.1 HTH-type transcriptional regulator gltC [Actinomyces viscosus]